MEAEINKKIMSTAYPSADFTAEVLSEGDAIVPDTKPDISEILMCEGRCSADKVEIQKGRVIFTGTASFTVLYRSENGDGVHSVTAKFPFNHIAQSEAVMPDDKALYTFKVADTKCSLINSRKLSLKAVVLISFTSYTELSVPLCSDILVPDAEVKRETVCTSSLGAYAKEDFTVSDILEIPESKAPLSETLLCRAEIGDTTVKFVTGKAVLKGNISVFHLYKTDEGAIEYMEHEIPFTEIADVSNLTEDMDSELTLSLGDYSSFCEETTDEKRSISFTSTLSMSLVAFLTTKESAVTDAYIPGSNSSLVTAPLKKSEIAERKAESVTLKDSADLPLDMPPMEKICPVYAYVSSKNTVCSDGKIKISGTVTALLSYISGNSIYSFKKDMDFSTEFDCPAGKFFVTSSAKVTHTDYNFVNQAKADIRAIVEIFVTVRNNTDSFPSITSMEISGSADTDRPSVIIYFVKSGDTLWNIAKHYKTTVDKILFANNMDGSEILNSGMRLIIPA